MALTTTRAEKAATTQRVKNKLTGASIGELIDQLDEIRERKRGKEEELKTIEAQYAATEQQVLEHLTNEKLDQAGGSKATASISRVTVAQVEDWDALFKYVKRTGYFHLFQRRLSDPACRELFESKGSIPGVTPFTKTKLNLRSK